MRGNGASLGIQVAGVQIAQTRRRAMAARPLPTAALIPFSLSRDDFFERRVSSTDELANRVETLEREGLDEVIVAYGELADLEAAAELIRGKAWSP